MVALGNSASLDRNKAIFDEVRAGRFQHDWCPLTLTDGVDTLQLLVSCDALKMPVSTRTAEGQTFSGDAVRINVDAFTQQEIADHLDAVLLTPLLVDRIYERSPKLSPSLRSPGPQMSSTRDMILHSETVDQKLSGAVGAEPQQAPRTQPTANVGKDWVVTGRIFQQSAIDANKSANYGWLGEGNSRSVTGLPAWQSIGLAHTAGLPESQGHVDYSQVSRFAHRSAILNGDPVDLGDVYTGRVGGTQLVSHEGPLPDFRIPQAQGPAKSLVEPPDGLPPPPPPPDEEPPPEPPTGPETAKKKDATGRVVGGGLVGAGIGWVTAGPVGAAIGALIGGFAGGATR